MNKNKIISFVVGGVVLVGVVFYAGLTYGKSKSTSVRGAGQGNFSLQNGGMAGGAGTRGMSRGGMAGGFVGGEIISKDDKSITVKLRDGGSKIIFLSSSTKVLKSVSGSSVDLLLGGQVIVTGTPSADGSIVAESLQIRPFAEVPKTQ
jgi:hypothetical protein